MDREYKTVMIGLLVVILVLVAIATKVGADRCQPTYTRIYETQTN